MRTIYRGLAGAATLFCSIIVAVLIAGILMSFYYRFTVDMLQEGDWLTVKDEIIGYKASANASSTRIHRKRGLKYNIYTDKRGARVNVPEQPVKEKIDLLTIGGSFSWGHGMENAQTFTALLGEELTINVANISFPGYGTLQSLQALENNIDLKPRAVIYGFIFDHMRRNLSPYAPSSIPVYTYQSHVERDEDNNLRIRLPAKTYSPEPSKNFYQEVVWDRKFGVADIKCGVDIVMSALEINFIRKFDDNYTLRLESMEFLIHRMLEVTRKSNSTLIVVHIPYLEKGKTNPSPDELLHSLTPDIVFVDMSPVVINHYTLPGNPELMLENDGHPNSLMHQLLAAEISKTLRERNIF